MSRVTLNYTRSQVLMLDAACVAGVWVFGIHLLPTDRPTDRTQAALVDRRPLLVIIRRSAPNRLVN